MAVAVVAASAAAAAVAVAGSAPVASLVAPAGPRHRADHAGQRPPRRHRDDAGGPVGHARLLGRVGGRDEPDELSGASHFLEHLLFKGTEDRCARQLAEAVDAVGGEMNAFTAQEHTAYYALLPHQQMALGRRPPRRRAVRARLPADEESSPSGR